MFWSLLLLHCAASTFGAAYESSATDAPPATLGLATAPPTTALLPTTAPSPTPPVLGARAASSILGAPHVAEDGMADEEAAVALLGDAGGALLLGHVMGSVEQWPGGDQWDAWLYGCITCTWEQEDSIDAPVDPPLATRVALSAHGLRQLGGALAIACAAAAPRARARRPSTAPFHSSALTSPCTASLHSFSYRLPSTTPSTTPFHSPFRSPIARRAECMHAGAAALRLDPAGGLRRFEAALTMSQVTAADY